MSHFDEVLAAILEEPEEALGVLNDVVNRGRLQAEDLPGSMLSILSEYELVAFLVERRPRQPTRTWVYPTPLGLRLYALLEREAERLEGPQRSGRTGSVRR